MKLLAALSTTLLAMSFASSAFAIDPAKCPASFKAEITSMRVYQSSISQKDPSWVVARNELRAASDDKTLNFTLTKQTKTTCAYAEAGGATAKLMTISIYDSEEREPYPSDRLLLQFSAGQSSYSMFPEVESYSTTDLRLYSQDTTQKTKIRAGKLDVGVAHIKTGL